MAVVSKFMFYFTVLSLLAEAACFEEYIISRTSDKSFTSIVLHIFLFVLPVGRNIKTNISVYFMNMPVLLLYLLGTQTLYLIIIVNKSCLKLLYFQF